MLSELGKSKVLTIGVARNLVPFSSLECPLHLLKKRVTICNLNANYRHYASATIAAFGDHCVTHKGGKFQNILTQ